MTNSGAVHHNLETPSVSDVSDTGSASAQILAEAARERLRDAKLGIDLGAKCTEATFAFANAAGAKEILRVRWPDAHVDHNTVTSMYELVGYVAMKDGRLITGPRTLECDWIVALKVVCLLLAGVALDEIAKQNGGLLLLQKMSSNELNLEMLMAALREHLTVVRDAAAILAADAALRLSGFVFTVPHHFSHRNREVDLKNWRNLIAVVVGEVWGDTTLEFDIASEGQAMANYSCGEDFYDSQFSLKRKELAKKYEGMNTKDGEVNVIIDFGASSMNIGSQVTYRDESGRIISSQSCTAPGWAPGGQGGSDTSNSVLHPIFDLHLRATYGDAPIPPGELGRLRQCWEREKHNLDFSQPDASVMIHGSKKNSSIQLFAEELQPAFEQACGVHMDILKKELPRHIDLGVDFMVQVTGGSSRNPGAKSMIQQYLDELVQVAESKGVVMRYVFLWEFDTLWSSAPSAGAALAAVNVPPAIDVLATSALAVHISSLGDDGVREGHNEADIIFRKGTKLDGAFVELPVVDLQQFSGLQMSLVCDPNSARKAAPSTRRRRRRAHKAWSRRKRITSNVITIGPASQVLNGPLSTYELDFNFDIDIQSLPSDAWLHFRLGGPDLNRLATAEGWTAMSREKSPKINLTLACMLLDIHNKPLVHSVDRKWAITLITDAPTKLLVVDEERDIPIRCQDCGENAPEGAYVCRQCPMFSLCWVCWGFLMSGADPVTPVHDASHEFDRAPA